VPAAVTLQDVSVVAKLEQQEENSCLKHAMLCCTTTVGQGNGGEWFFLQ
jgi:hypothetical protein